MRFEDFYLQVPVLLAAVLMQTVLFLMTDPKMLAHAGFAIIGALAYLKICESEVTLSPVLPKPLNKPISPPSSIPMCSLIGSCTTPTYSRSSKSNGAFSSLNNPMSYENSSTFRWGWMIRLFLPVIMVVN